MSQSTSGRWLASPPPPAAVEISSRRVTAVGIAAQGDTPVVTAQTSEGLPEGAVTPSVNAVNVHDPAGLAGALRVALDRLTPRPRRVALILPDTVAKVSLLRFEKLPAKVQEFEQLVRWQMRKAVPFRIDDAQLSWVEGEAAAGGGREFLVLASRRDIIESYERACDAAGVHAGLVDIASTNLVNAALAAVPGASTGDWLLVHTAAEYATLVVVRNGRVIFYRNRPSDGGALNIGELVHQTAMYYEDRLGGAAFTRVLLAGGSVSGGDADLVRRQIEERLGARVEPLDVRGAVSLRDRIAAGPELLETLAPAVGVLLRERPAAAPTRGRVAS